MSQLSEEELRKEAHQMRPNIVQQKKRIPKALGTT